MSLVSTESGFSVSKTPLSKKETRKKSIAGEARSNHARVSMPWGNNGEKETLLRGSRQLYPFLGGVSAVNIPVHFGEWRQIDLALNGRLVRYKMCNQRWIFPWRREGGAPPTPTTDRSKTRCAASLPEKKLEYCSQCNRDT